MGNEMNGQTQKLNFTKEEIIQMVDVTEDIREILNVPNKNNLYKDLGLNPTYLNLKNFIAGREPELKKKSLRYLTEKLNVLPLTIFLDLDDLDEEDLLALKKIQLKFINKLVEYAKKFEGDQRRIKAKPVTEDDVKMVEEILNQAAVNIDLSELNIQI